MSRLAVLCITELTPIEVQNEPILVLDIGLFFICLSFDYLFPMHLSFSEGRESVH